MYMKVNVYDFDGTIYYGDSTRDFIKYCYKIQYLNKRDFIKIGYLFLKYVVGIIDKTEFKQNVFSFFSRIDDIDTLVSEFWITHKSKIKSFYLEKKHDKDIINSASPYFLLEPICKELKVMDLIASDVDKKTGIYYGLNNDSFVKVDTLYKKYPNVKVMEMYSDSINDKPLLDIAKKSYMLKNDLIYDYNDYKSSIFRRLWDLYRGHLEVFNYLFIGGCTTLISIIIYAFCTRLFGLSLIISNIISWIISVIFAYFSNRVVVFKSSSTKYLKEFLSFTSSRIITLFLDTFLMILFVKKLFINDIISKIIVQIVVIIGNYILSKLFVFKKKVD